MAEFDFEGNYVPPSCLSNFIDMGSDVSHNYYKARKTVLEMLRDRGYTVANEEVELTLQQFRDRYGDEVVDFDSLRLRKDHKDDPNNKIVVHFFGPSIVKVKCIHPLLNLRLSEEPISRLILVSDNKMTKKAKDALELFPFKVEIFQIPELIVNITKHVTQPKYEVLTAEEKQMLLEKCKIRDSDQLPRMLETDAVARYYAYEKGTWLKITHSGKAGETQVTYRIVW